MSSMPWIARLKPQPRLRLFCFPYAGGGALVYRQWAALLPESVDLCPVQLPGRETRLAEAPLSQFNPLIEALVDGLQPALDVPFAFFGFSMGALISFELTRQLRRLHRPLPRQLLLAAHRAPQLPRRGKTMSTLSDAEFIETLKHFGGTPEVVLRHSELMQLLLPMLRADFTLCETYRYTPEAPLICPITVFGGEQDQQVSQSELAAWHEQSTADFMLKMFPGAHFFLQSHQEQLLQAVTECLAAL